MTPRDKELFKRAMQLVESKYSEDCPYYKQLVRDMFYKLKEHDTRR